MGACQAKADSLDVASLSNRLKTIVKLDTADVQPASDATSDLSESNLSESLKFPGPADDNLPLLQSRDFSVYEILGKGSFGKVVLVFRKADQKFYALKILDKLETLKEHGLDFVHRIEMEKRFLERISHPFFARMEAVYRKGHHVFFLNELCRCGTMKSLLEEKGKLPEELVRIYAGQILLFLIYLHKLSIVHRDLRPDNIMIHEDGYIRVIDIGVAAEIRPSSGSKSVLDNRPSFNSKVNVNPTKLPSSAPVIGADLKEEEIDFSSAGALETIIGANGWKAPEMQLKQGYDFGADFWSFGICIYVMLTGKHPFDSGFGLRKNLDRSSISGKGINFPKYISMEAQDLINKLLVPDPIKRINSTVEMMRSGSLSQCGDSDSKIRIQRFPGDGLEILKHPWFSGLDWEALERKELELPRYSPKYTNDPKAHVRFKNINDVIFEFRRRDESFLMENLDLASK